MKLVTTSVVRGSHPGETHGGIYLVDLDARGVDRLLDWRPGGDRLGRGWDRGPRGIACHRGLVYVAASDALLAFTPDFHPAGSWRNAYLSDCQGLSNWEQTLYVASAGCDSVLGFSLETKEFTWGMQVVSQRFRFQGRRFDPRKDDGPLMLNKLHLNSIHCAQGGMYVTGLKSGGMLLFNGKKIQMAAELPAGTHNAQPFRDGVLFNDTDADAVRYAGRGEGREDRALKVPRYTPEELQNRHVDQSQTARQGFARGLCVLAPAVVAGGSSPSTVSVYDLAANQRVMSVNLSMDVRNAIHGLEIWPYG